jgi:SAM-dependent methyltransferase
MGEGHASSNQRLCPACGCARGQSRGQKNKFQLIACRSCATLYTQHLPNTNTEQDYDSYYTHENLTVPAFLESRVDGIVSKFEPYRENGRLLDVGCGAGTFLEAAARAGWEATGVEVSRTAAEHVRSRGFEVFFGELEKAGYAGEHFGSSTVRWSLIWMMPPTFPILARRMKSLDRR